MIADRSKPGEVLQRTHVPGEDTTLMSEKRSGGSVVVREIQSSPYGYVRKLGLLAWSIIVIGTALIIASLSFLAFLWAADASNITWHRIVMNGWMTRAVSLTSLVLRNSMVLQAGALSSMLAALALERAQVLFDQLASVCTMRNATSGPYWLCWLLFKSALKSPRPGSNVSVFSIVFILVIISVLGQFISTLLLSDLQPPASLPGFPKTRALPTGFQYLAQNGSWQRIQANTQVSSWTQKAPFYPTFAEYASGPPADTPDTAVDTGSVLRAFLPFSNQKDRNAINSYHGQATVVDTRVVCQAPFLNNTQLFRNFRQLALTTALRPRWTNSDLVDVGHVPEQQWDNVNACYMAEPDATASGQWPLSICQVGYAGGLFSVFSKNHTYLKESPGNDLVTQGMQVEYVPENEGTPPGAQYLALNITKGSSIDWETVIGEVNVTSQSAALWVGRGMAPFSMTPRGEWLDLTFDPHGALTLSVSLCHTAFDSADLDVSITSPDSRFSQNVNLTEPFRSFDSSSKAYDYNQILRQFGQAEDGSFVHGVHAQRGILALAPRSWLPRNASDSPRANFTSSYLLNAARLEGPLDPLVQYGPLANFTGFLSDVSLLILEKAVWKPVFVDSSLVGLMQAIVHNGGSMAHALQSAITVLASMTYYDQLDRFDHQDSVQLLNFEESVLFPQRNRGIAAVAAVVIAHILLVVSVTLFFIRGTRVSSLGNAWQAVAQVVDPRTSALLARVQLKTDDRVRQAMVDGLDGGTSQHDEYVALEAGDQEGRTRMVSRGHAQGRGLGIARRRRGADDESARDV